MEQKKQAKQNKKYPWEKKMKIEVHNFLSFEWNYEILKWTDKMRQKKKINNNLHPNISMYILYTILNIFPRVLIRRICQIICLIV